MPYEHAMVPTVNSACGMYIYIYIYIYVYITLRIALYSISEADSIPMIMVLYYLTDQEEGGSVDVVRKALIFILTRYDHETEQMFVFCMQLDIDNNSEPFQKLARSARTNLNASLVALPE